MQENLSSGFPTRSCLNQPIQLQRLARMLKLRMKQVGYHSLQETNNKGADQTSLRISCLHSKNHIFLH